MNPMNSKDLDEMLTYVKDTVYEAGEIIMSYQKQRHKLKLKDKGTSGLATQADEASEKFLSEQLLHKYPDIKILGEESSECIDTDYFLEKNEICWVIDPLDGTNNFINGVPIYGVSVCLCRRKKPLLGIVYNPFSGECFFAIKNRGAFFQDFKLNPMRILELKACTNSKSAEECIFSPAPSYNGENRFENQLATLKKNITGARAVRRLGSAAIELCYVASGNFDGYWEKGLQVWDTFAAWLICSESNVEITDFAGQAFNYKSDSIVAARQPLHGIIVKGVASKNKAT